MPLYLRFLDAEEFGLIGFFTVLNAGIFVLSSGLVPVLARQVAVFRAKNALGAFEFMSSLRNIELVIFGLMVSTALFFLQTSNWISHQWLNATRLDPKLVAHSVSTMGIILAARWGLSLYSSGLAGLERQVLLNGFNVIVATLRWIGGLILIAFISDDIGVFFTYQAGLAILELLTIGILFYTGLPKRGSDSHPGFRFCIESLVEILPFTLATIYTAVLWAFLTQFDKLFLSKVLPLELYGYFAFATLLSNGVMRISQPINQAILPRLTYHIAQMNGEATGRLYRRNTQFLAVVAIPVSAVLATFPKEVLFTLSGNQALSDYGAPVLRWFALGNGILAMSSLLFSLQIAFGQLRLHVLSSTVSVLIQVPVVIYVATYFDAVAVGISWFVIRLTMFAVSAPLVHLRFNPGPFSRWVLVDIGMPLLGTLAGIVIVLAAHKFVFIGATATGRGALLALVVAYTTVTIAFAVACSSEVRTLLWGSRLISIIRRLKSR